MLDKVENDGMAIIAIASIAIMAMFLLGIDSKEIVLCVGSGLVGFLKGKSSS